MKDGLKFLPGKEIAAVVVAQADRDPRNQVFLVFQDGSSFEFRGPAFSCGGGLSPAEGIEQYVESGSGRVVQVYGDVRSTAPARPLVLDGEGGPAEEVSPTGRLMGRDLAAWRAAKAVIAKAKAR